MSLINKIEVCPLAANTKGRVKFYSSQTSHETMLVKIRPKTIDNLFVHSFQSDQLLVVQGSFVLVVLQNRHYHYLGLNEQQPTVVKIPPGIPHGAINFSSQPCVMVNAVLRHGPAHERDYRPLKPPFAYDLTAAKKAFESIQTFSANPSVA